MTPENAEYVRSRNKLIMRAAKFADNETGNPLDPDWDRIFIREMDRLAVESGIQEVRYHK
jgi:hypothetical protein